MRHVPELQASGLHPERQYAGVPVGSCRIYVRAQTMTRDNAVSSFLHGDHPESWDALPQAHGLRTHADLFCKGGRASSHPDRVG